MARLEGETLVEAELAPNSWTWTLGSWVVRDRFEGEAGKTLVHISFLPVGLFSEGRARALARVVGALARLRTTMPDGAPCDGENVSVIGQGLRIRVHV